MRTQDSADKRIKRLSLTETGRKKIAELLDIHNNWLRDIMTCLSSEEQKQFENYCERLLAAAEKSKKPILQKQRILHKNKNMKEPNGSFIFLFLRPFPKGDRLFHCSAATERECLRQALPSGTVQSRLSG